MRTELDWLACAGIGSPDGLGGVLNTSGTQTTDTPTTRSVLRDRFTGFAPELLCVINDSEGALANRPVFVLPTPTSWANRAGITLLGDAVHVMSPFGGTG